MRLFLSTFINKVDRKGRVSVPATFRTALADLPLAGIVAYRGFTAPRIEGSGIDHMQRMLERAQQFDPFSPEADDITSLIFADARQLPWDPEGRVMLPEDLLEHAGITETAAFVGAGATFQIWNPDTYKAAQAEIRARASKTRPSLPPAPNGSVR